MASIFDAHDDGSYDGLAPADCDPEREHREHAAYWSRVHYVEDELTLAAEPREAACNTRAASFALDAIRRYAFDRARSAPPALPSR